MGFNVDILEIVSMMISKFKTVLREPEDIVVEQFTDTDDMYLIAKGACEVFIVDEKKNRNRRTKPQRVENFWRVERRLLANR